MNSLIVLWAVCTVLAVPVGAEQLAPAGVLGNSGRQGCFLVKVDAAAVGQGGSGVAADRDLTLWTGAGTFVNHLSLNGSLIETVPLAPSGSVIDSPSFALLDDHLYFFGKTPDKRWALFGLDLRVREKGVLPPARPVVADLPAVVPGRRHLLSGQPLNGRLLMAIDKEGNYDGTTKAADRRLTIYAWKPGAPGFVSLCGVPGFAPNGIAADPARQRIYVGGRLFPRPGSVSTADIWAITAVNEQGELAGPEFPSACGQTMYGPVQFVAHVNAAGGALWDLAWYGYLARLAPDGSGDPGGIEKWHHELGALSQIVDMGDAAGRPSGVLACAAGGAGGTCHSVVYLGHWQSLAHKIDWVRRIGCLPVITSLWLTPEGWVSVGTEYCQAWWRFDDAADAPARKAELHIAVTPTVQRGDQCLGLAALYSLDYLSNGRPVPMAFSWVKSGIDEARGLGEAVPLKKPVGLTVENPALDGSGRLFVSDADSRKIWCTKVWRPGLNPDNAQWKPLVYADPAAEKMLETATDLAWLTDDTLVAAVDNALVWLKPGDAGYGVARRFEKWGETAEARFGRRLRFSVSGARMLVADTDRQRVLLFDLASRALLAQAGETDRAGTDSRHFNCPTLVSLCGGRAVVADTGNQRVVKLIVSTVGGPAKVKGVE